MANLRPATYEWRAMAAIVLLLVAILISLAARTGVTVDEPAHLVSSYLYWHGRDNLEPGDMPPLMKIVCGWVPRLMKLPLPPPNHSDWKTRHEWNVSQAMMFDLPAKQIRSFFFYSRLPMIIFPAGCCVLLWWWGRQLFTPMAALLSALAFALSPTVLAHGALVKNDLAAAFGYFFFWHRAWSYWHRPDTVRAVWLGVALLIAVLSKFSLFILTPAVPLLFLARMIATGRFTARAFFAAMAVVAVIGYCGALAAWQMEVGRPSDELFQRWKDNPQIPQTAVSFVSAASNIPTPARLWTGAMSLVESNSGEGGVYLRGKVIEGGDPLYFVTALSVKIPIAQQLLCLMGIFVCLWQFARGRLPLSNLLWFGPPILYLALASMSSLQHGVRLVLPALVFLLLISGKAMQLLLSIPSTRLLPAILIGLLGLNTATAYPDYISYFNQWIGGPDNGLSVLSDSNLDWGQDVPRLAEYVRHKGIKKIHLSYFGSDSPHRYLAENQIIWQPPPWSDELVRGTRLEPEPGYYAISATLLTGQLFVPKYRVYYADFRNRKPVAKAGYSIFIYEVR